MIAIIDYGMGNLNSVLKKVHFIGKEAVITSNPIEIRKASKIILPGVGHFDNGVKNLKRNGLWDLLNDLVIVDKKPILGICLGMQLMMSYSEEGNSYGFDWVQGKVVKFISENERFKIPHMGWNSILPQKKSLLTNGLNIEDEFYFVHSYFAHCEKKEDVLFRTNYFVEFTSGIQKNNIYGVQFHPEKSHQSGHVLIQNFLNNL